MPCQGNTAGTLEIFEGIAHYAYSSVCIAVTYGCSAHVHLCDFIFRNHAGFCIVRVELLPLSLKSL